MGRKNLFNNSVADCWISLKFVYVGPLWVGGGCGIRSIVEFVGWCVIASSMTSATDSIKWQCVANSRLFQFIL